MIFEVPGDVGIALGLLRGLRSNFRAWVWFREQV